jgi:hypothetical protein
VLPGGGGRSRVPSMRGVGSSFSVTGNAHSGFSTAAARPGTSMGARIMAVRMQTTFFMESSHLRPLSVRLNAAYIILRRRRPNNRLDHRLLAIRFLAVRLARNA